MKDRLLMIAEKAGLNAKEVDTLIRRRRVERIILPITGLIITVISTIIGYIVGTAADPQRVISNASSYPYAAPIILVGINFWDRNRILISVVALATIVLSFIGFSIGYDAGRPFYEVCIAYGVYSQDRSAR